MTARQGPPPEGAGEGSSPTDAGDAGSPLFVTRCSLSSRTATGVQTRLILEHFSTWHHVFWRRYEFRSQDRSSHCAENVLIARSTRLRKMTPLMGLLARLNVTSWDGDSPTTRGRAFLQAFKGRASSAYFAPIDTSDARRMRATAEILDLPFVLHVWDFLDDGLRSGDGPTRWLIEKADAVLCGSEQILHETRQVRPDARLLLFARHPSNHVAIQRPDATPRIALMGDIVAYREGVLMLLAAVTLLRAQGYGVTVRYIGREGALRQIGVPRETPIESVGFLPSDEARDRAIAACDIGFLPGPLGDPESDPRSRYSIPSRVLDFLAAGLPIVGAVHPRSATFQFCSELGVSELMACASPTEIASAIRVLRDARTWSALSDAGRGAFAALTRADHYDDLTRALREAATRVR